jgi:ubiquinone biosynthesis protein
VSYDHHIVASSPSALPPRSSDAPPALIEARREGLRRLAELRPAGLVRRFLVTWRHVLGFCFGALAVTVKPGPGLPRRGIGWRVLQLISWFTRKLVARDYLAAPVPVQLRRRLEALGPTYVKLGQILSLREDLLPQSVTIELKNLLDRLPAIPFEDFLVLVERELGRDPREVFTYIESMPIGSASIGQAHRAGTHEGHAVILKVVKPGIRETLVRDVVLLRGLGWLLQLVIPRFQPRRVIEEFCVYTLREVDLELEADHAETFAANFQDEESVVFPRIHRRYSTRNLLCMELLRGVRPDSLDAQRLSESDRDRLVDLGASAIVRMLFRDGFFHADLHPGNLLLLPGPRLGFIDLGMVGRFSIELRRLLFYYYSALVLGDVENAARYLSEIAHPDPRKGDVDGFRREVEEVCRRFRVRSPHGGASLGRLILDCVTRGGKYRMYFPVEMVLMVKALVTFEGVGRILMPNFDVAEVSRGPMRGILLHHLSPARIAQEAIRAAPELLDALLKAPGLVGEGVRFLEHATSPRRQPESPLTGLRSAVLGGFCLVAGAILVSMGGQLLPGIVLLALGGLLAVWR